MSLSRRQVMFGGMALGVIVLLVPGCDAEATHLVELICQRRGPIARDLALDDYAHKHAEAMAAAGRLWHTDLWQLPGQWAFAGEIVGHGEVDDVFRAFLDSPTHREVIDNPVYKRLGAGGHDGYYAVVFAG